MVVQWKVVDCVWNVMARAQKPDFIFRWNGRVHLNRQGHQVSRLLAAEVCASAVVMVDTPWSEVVCRVLATHSICQFPLRFPSRASPCAIKFQLDSTKNCHLETFTAPCWHLLFSSCQKTFNVNSQTTVEKVWVERSNANRTFLSLPNYGFLLALTPYS